MPLEYDFFLGSRFAFSIFTDTDVKFLISSFLFGRKKWSIVESVYFTCLSDINQEIEFSESLVEV